MTCCSTNNIFQHVEFLPPIYLDDDIYVELNSLTSLNIDITSLVECSLALVNNSTVLLTSWITQVDLTNGNNFAQKVIKPLLQRTDFNTVPAGRYVIMLRLTTNSITQTYKTNKIVTIL